MTALKRRGYVACTLRVRVLLVLWCWSAVAPVLPEVRVRKESPDLTRFHVSICGVSKSPPVVQFPNLGAGCGFCVAQAARWRLAARVSSFFCLCRPCGYAFSGASHEGNVQVTRLHCSSVYDTFLLRQIITGEVKRGG